MLSSACDLEIYKRLVGYPIDSSGRPVKVAGIPNNKLIIRPPGQIVGEEREPSYGIVLPEPRDGYDFIHNLTTKTPDAVRLFEKGFVDTFRQIPVFSQTINGEDFRNIFPCVFFRNTGFAPRSTDYMYHDPIRKFDTTSTPVSILDEDDEIVSGFSKLIERPHPDPYTLTYNITVQAKTPMELGMLREQVVRMFPFRGVLEVEHMDGSVLPFDMFQTRSVDLSGDNLGVEWGPEQRSLYVHRFTYVIEAYEDNTLNRFGSRAVVQRDPILESILEIADLQTKLLIQPSYYLTKVL